MKFILILTMALTVKQGGHGGVAMHEFDSLTACKSAGERWAFEMQKTKPDLYRGNHSFYLCVPKGEE